jgi:hypothetical protein
VLLFFIKIRTRKRGKKVKTMQKQDYAIYVPVDASRVQWYFLNRTEAFRTQFDAATEMLIGYKRYDDAVKAGRSRFGQDGACFAILSISFNEHVRNALAMSQWLDDASEEAQTKVQSCWPSQLTRQCGSSTPQAPSSTPAWTPSPAAPPKMVRPGRLRPCSSRTSRKTPGSRSNTNSFF